MKKILISAFACNPIQGGEPSNGWNMATLLSKDFEVHCLLREIDKVDVVNAGEKENLTFHYIKIPHVFEKFWKLSFWGQYVTYLVWQWYAYQYAKKIHNKMNFSLVHHVSWGSLQLGTFMYKLDTKLVLGPLGGGQVSYRHLKKIFGKYWLREEIRGFISEFLILFNPGCKKSIRKASHVFVSNKETFDIVCKLRGSKDNIEYFFPSLSEKFLFDEFPTRQINETTKVLWLGRLLPRKGVKLALEAFSKIPTEYSIQLSIVGDGEMKVEIDEYINKYKLKDKVFQLGKISHKDIIKLYLESDLFLFTSVRDSVGAQIVEAMSTGLPVIGLNMHGQAIVINNERGLKAKVSSIEVIVEDLKEHIIKLHRDIYLREKLSIGAFNFGQQQLWIRKIKKVKAVYKNLN